MGEDNGSYNCVSLDDLENRMAKSFIARGWTPPGDHPVLAQMLAVVEAAVVVGEFTGHTRTALFDNFEFCQAFAALEEAVQAWRGAQGDAER